MASKSRSIGQRMGLVLGPVLLIALVGSGLGWRALLHVGERTQEVVSDSVATERLVSEWQRHTGINVARATAIVASTDASLAAELAPAMAETSQAINAVQKQVEALANTAEEKRLLERLGGARSSYLKVREKVLGLRKSGKADEARQAFETEFKPAAAAYLEAMQAVSAHERSQFDAAAADVARINQQARLALLLFSVLAIVTGALLGLWLTRSIGRPVQNAARLAEGIATYDLTQSVPAQAGPGTRETDQLLSSLDDMQSAFRSLITGVRSAADSVGTASAEISDASLDLSHRTEVAASSLQQAASAISELNDTVRATDQAASNANRLAAEAAAVAQRGQDRAPEQWRGPAHERDRARGRERGQGVYRERDPGREQVRAQAQEQAHAHGGAVLSPVRVGVGRAHAPVQGRAQGPERGLCPVRSGHDRAHDPGRVRARRGPDHDHGQVIFRGLVL
jgi:methyl-accepting chemotaxis protein